MALIQKAFSDIITFSRSSNATRIGPNGLIQYAPHNLILQSQTFETTWTLTRATLSVNSTAAPDGTVTADKLIDSVDANSHFIQQSATIVSGSVYTASFYAKAGGRNWATIWVTNIGTSANTYFDLQNGVLGTIGTGVTATITSVGNGWYRCTVTGTAVSTSTVAYIGTATANGTNTAAGDGTSGIFIWGAQLAVGPLALDYTPTTTAAVYGPRFDYDGSGVTSVDPIARNLLTYSQEFDNAAWVKSNGSVSANASTAPDGTLSADKFVENSTASVHSIINTIGAAQPAGAYCYSIYVKADGRSQVLIQNTITTTYGATFDLTALTVLSTTNATGSIVDVGNGWRRCTFTFTSSTSITFNFAVYPLVSGSGFYQGDGTSGLLLWGAQLELGSTATGYMVSGATNGFRADPIVTGSATALGLLIEEQRTNLQTNSDAFGAWTIENGSVSSNVRVGPDGVISGDKFTPNTTSSGAHRVMGVVISQTTLTYSVFIKADGYTRVALRESTTNGAAAGFDLANQTIITTYSVGGCTVSNAKIQSYGNGWYRISATFSYAIATNQRLGIYVVSSNWTSGDPESVAWSGDGTSGVLIWGAQVEAGAFATSYIPTLASTVTRSADVASVNTLSPFYNAVEGTLFAELSGLLSTSYFQAPAYSFGDSNNRIELRAVGNPFTYNRAVVTTAGVTQADISSTGLPSSASASRKVALAYKLDDFATVGTSGTVATDTSGTIPTVSVLNIGTAPYDSSIKTNGWIARIAYYPRRLTNAELQALTA